MRLWDFALAAWARPGVEAACLDLQDRHGQSVALLLWRAWTRAERRPVAGDLAQTAIALARTWEEGVLTPLRAARRAAGRSEGRLRSLVRAAELEAERTLLDRLEALTPAPDRSPPIDPAEVLAALASDWNGAKLSAAELAAVRALC